MAINGCSELLSGGNATIVPGVDQALPVETREMDLHLVAEILVNVGIGEEEGSHPTSVQFVISANRGSTLIDFRCAMLFVQNHVTRVSQRELILVTCRIIRRRQNLGG